MKIDDIPSKELEQAIALQYDGHRAPVIVAKGTQEDAKEIIQLAKEHDIPMCDNAVLVDLLSRMELGDEIPEALYLSIAYVLSFAYRMTESTKELNV